MYNKFTVKLKINKGKVGEISATLINNQMQHPYSIEWYDLLVCVTLNPAKTDVTAITEAQTDSILKRADEEKEKIKVQLKERYTHSGITRR